MPLTKITLDALGSSITINADALTSGTVPLNRLSAANSSANGIVTTSGQTFAGDKTFQNTVTVTGNLTVLGTSVTLNSETVLIKDNIITLNSNVTGAPVLDAGIEINRGTSANVILKWNETSDKWQLTNDGTTYETIVLPSMSANTSANGVVDTTTQTFAGLKTFNSNATFSGSRTFFASGSVLDWNSGDVTLTHSANTLTFGGASSGYVFSDGNVGIGVAPSAWTGYKALEIGTVGSGVAATTSSGTIQFNGSYYYASGDKFGVTGNYAMYFSAVPGDGSYRWYTSTATGTAGNAATMAERMRIDSSGHTRPGADNAQDLGTASYRWRNVYSADLQLSNEGSSNDVDGTWGSWTIQEGEHNLFLLNRRTKKKYKFVIEEVQ